MRFGLLHRLKYNMEPERITARMLGSTRYPQSGSAPYFVPSLVSSSDCAERCIGTLDGKQGGTNSDASEMGHMSVRWRKADGSARLS